VICGLFLPHESKPTEIDRPSTSPRSNGTHRKLVPVRTLVVTDSQRYTALETLDRAMGILTELDSSTVRNKSTYECLTDRRGKSQGRGYVFKVIPRGARLDAGAGV
jgi:hypothetical protein